MPIHHSTEYSINGGAWLLVTADEEAGPNKSFVPAGAVNGDLIRLRITPLTGGGAVIISDVVVFSGVVENFVNQNQTVQTQSVTGLSGYIGTGVQSQNQAQAISTTLNYVGNGTESQAVQVQQGAAPAVGYTGTIVENQAVQTQNITGSFIQYATVINNQAKATEQGSGSLVFSGIITEPQSIQVEASVAWQGVPFSGTISQNQAKSVEVVNGNVAVVTPGTVTDNFNRANSSDLGSNWADVGVSNTGITSNQASGAGRNRWNGPESFNANQYAQAKVNGYGSEVVVRAANSAITCYYGTFNFDEAESSDFYGIYKLVAGVLTPLVETFTIEAFTYLRLEVSGTTLTLKHSNDDTNWNTFESVTDSQIATGKPGFGLSTGTIDDFQGGNL